MSFPKNNLNKPQVILKNIFIDNFRGFKDFRINFDPKLNVIIGDNGSGKTSVLDAIHKAQLRILWTFYREIFYKEKSYRETESEKLIQKNQRAFGFAVEVENYIAPIDGKFFFDAADINDEKLYPKINAEFCYEKEDIKVSISKEALFNFIGYDDWKETDKKVERFKKFPSIPLFDYFKTLGTPLEHIEFKDIPNQIKKFEQLNAYDGINKKSFDFQKFFIWYKWQENIEKQLGANRVIQTVRNAIYSILSDNKNKFDNLYINWLNDPNGEMFINKNGTPFNINQLSSGEKTLLILTAELAYRLALANPKREDPLQGYGIILIDEIDLHLHPKWQKAIIPQLQKIFTNCQFIITTHSPLVLSGIKPENIIILSDFKAIEKVPHTFGKDTNSILYELMGVKKRPEQMQQKIDRVYQLIDIKNNIQEAKNLLKELAKDLGENEAEILKAYTHINFMED